MGITNTVEHIAEEIVAAKAADLGAYILRFFLGDKANDTAAEKVARAAAEGGIAAATALASEHLAAEELEAKTRKMTDAIAKWNVAAMFSAKPSNRLEYDAETTVQLTPLSWAIVELASRDTNTIGEATESERANLGAVGRVLGHLIVTSDRDRDVPDDIQSVIDRNDGAVIQLTRTSYDRALGSVTFDPPQATDPAGAVAGYQHKPVILGERDIAVPAELAAAIAKG